MRRNEVVAVRRLRTRRRPRRGHDDADHDAKMNDADPEAWPADVLARIAEHPTSRLDDLSLGIGVLAKQAPSRRLDLGCHHNSNI